MGVLQEWVKIKLCLGISLFYHNTLATGTVLFWEPRPPGTIAHLLEERTLTITTEPGPGYGLREEATRLKEAPGSPGGDHLYLSE